MKKSIIIAAIITAIAIIGILLFYFIPKSVSYTFEGMIHHGIDSYYPATLEIHGKANSKSFEGTVTFTAEGKTQTIEAEAEIKKGCWRILNKDYEENGIELAITLLPDFPKGKCSASIEESTVHYMSYNIFAAPAANEDEFYDVLDHINEKFGQ